MRRFVGNLPERIRHLPQDVRGFPVPYFVAWIGDQPHFPVLDPAKLAAAIWQRRCWICGQPLGAFTAFVVGPMCCVNRISSEPPSHSDCARFAALNCPFLAHPMAKRTVGRDDEIGGAVVENPAGVMIERNPGVSCVWVTKSHKLQRERGGVLFRIGPPERLEFYASGRRATRAEVDHSVETGLPALEDMAKRDGAIAERDLRRAVIAFTALLDTVPWPLPDVDLAELGFEEAGS